MQPRRTEFKLTYDNVDISADLQNYLISWSYTDNLSGQADDLQVTLEDREQLWVGDWTPEQGATLKASATRYNRKFEGTEEELNLGTFEIDEIEKGYPPSVVTIKSISIPESSSLRGEAKNKAWEETKLSIVANDITKGAGLKLFYDTNEDPEYDRIEQTEETDLKFLVRLCNDAGMCLKISDSQIVIFDEQKYEQQAPFTRVMIGEAYLKDYKFRSTLNGVYSSCRVQYHDASKNEKIEYTFTPPNPPKTGRVLVINERVASVQEAERLAKKRLREKNKNGVTGSMALMGDVRFVAGLTIRTVGFGVLDGNYIISQANHSQDSSGHITRIEIRKCLEGY